MGFRQVQPLFFQQPKPAMMSAASCFSPKMSQMFSTLQDETFAQRLDKIKAEALQGGGQARIDK